MSFRQGLRSRTQNAPPRAQSAAPDTPTHPHAYNAQHSPPAFGRGTGRGLLGESPSFLAGRNVVAGDRNAVAGDLDPAPLFHNDEGDPYYRVERIFAHRADPRERSFLVRWAGYDASHDSWEPEHRLRADVPLLLDAYLANPSTLQKRPSAPLRRSLHTRH